LKFEFLPLGPIDLGGLRAHFFCKGVVRLNVMDFATSLVRFLMVVAVSVGALAAQVKTMTLPFDPASVGATKTAFRWSIVCDAKTRTSNLDQQPSWIISGSTVTVTLIAGALVCYQFWYMTDTLIPVGQPSAIQLVRVPLAARLP